MIFIYRNKRLVIKNPEFNNSYRIPLGINLQSAMSGKRYSYVNKTKTIIQTFVFKGLTREKIIELFTFIQDIIGKDIQITDHNNEKWNGKFINDPLDSINESKTSSTISLAFEGIRI